MRRISEGEERRSQLGPTRARGPGGEEGGVSEKGDAWGLVRGWLTVLLGDVAELLEEPAAVLAADNPELAPCCCGRAGDMAEAGPVADTCDQGPDEKRPDGTDKGFV
jgi:hypothetical protein